MFLAFIRVMFSMCFSVGCGLFLYIFSFVLSDMCVLLPLGVINEQ